MTRVEERSGGSESPLASAVLTTKAAHSCPPLIWPIQPFHCRSARASHGAHALLMAVHEVVGTQHAPARARLRLAAVLVARTTSCWSVRAMGRSGQATVRPPSSSLVGRQSGCQASTKSHLSSRRTTARNHPRQGAKVHLLASEVSLRLPDVRSACAVTGRQ